MSFIHADSGFYFDWLAFPPLMFFLYVFYYLFINLFNFGAVLVVPLCAFMCIVLSVYLFKSVKVLKYFCLEWLIIFWWKLLFDAHRDQIKILKPRLQSFKCQLKMWNYFSLYVHDVFLLDVKHVPYWEKDAPYTPPVIPLPFPDLLRLQKAKKLFYLTEPLIAERGISQLSQRVCSYARICWRDGKL